MYDVTGLASYDKLWTKFTIHKSRYNAEVSVKKKTYWMQTSNLFQRRRGRHHHRCCYCNALFFALHHHLVCCYFIKSIHYSIQIVMTMMMCNKMNEICLQTTIKVEDVDFMAGVFLLCVSKTHIVFNASMRSGTTDCTYSFESH